VYCLPAAYFHFIPYQITFAYTAPPTGLLTNGETMTHFNTTSAQRRAGKKPKFFGNIF